jgi:hypothetical protein
MAGAMCLRCANTVLSMQTGWVQCTQRQVGTLHRTLLLYTVHHVVNARREVVGRQHGLPTLTQAPTTRCRQLLFSGAFLLSQNSTLSLA